MFIDKQLEVSNDQALTASAASESYINQGAAGDARNPLRLVVSVPTVLVSSGKAATLTIALQGHEDASFSTGTKTLWQSGAITEAECVAGAVLCDVPVPAGAEQYLRVYYTVGTENFTSGNINAEFVVDADSNK